VRNVLRHRGIAALLLAEIVSTTGSQMTWLALPWFVLATTGSASRMGFVLAAEAAGIALCAVPGGWAAGKLGARRTLLVANAAAAPLVLAVPVLHWAGTLSFGLLLAISFVTGSVWGPYFAAQRVVLPEILGEDERAVSEANALLQASQRATLLLGPVLAGVLIGVIGAPSVLVVDAATFVFALVVIGGAVPAGRPLPLDEGETGVLAGLRYLLRDRLLRGWTLSMAVGDAAWSALFASLPFYAFTRYHQNPRVAGLLLACFGVAAVAGNLLSFRIRRHVSARNLIAFGILAQAAALWLLAAAGAAWIVGLSLFLAGLANGIVNPSLHAMFTLLPPPRLRAQVLSAVAAADQIATPAGFVGTGLVLAHLGLRWIFVGVPALQTLAMGARALTTLRAGDRLPSDRDAALAA
jgi:MFS family permease